MKPSITFAEIRSIVSFLKKYEGGYIEKNYIDGGNISFKIRKSGLNSVYLHFMNNDFLFISPENAVEGKKNILPVENMQIHSIKQMGTDRVIIIEGQKKIIIEMMGGGNLIITEGGEIIFSKKQTKRMGITLQKGTKYIEPDIIDLESPYFSIEDRIKESKADPLRTLATRIGLSKYSEEIICAMGKNIKTNDDILNNLENLKMNISELLRMAEEGNIYIYRDQFFVWKSKCLTEEPVVMNISEAMKYIYDSSLKAEESREISIRRDIQKMQEEMERLKNYGEFIMANLQDIDHFLFQARKNNLDQNLIDYERGIARFIKDDKEIPLKMALTAGENANEFFSSAKKIKEKLSRVSNIEKEEKIETVPKIKVHRIFTNYRWFITSEGNLVISGKDAETNDSVVKKYLDEKDLYLHADIHGAPSVILKNKNGIGEKSIEEAAQFAWCMSRAWNSQYGNGAVFYVTKSQVSKTPESGEYLAKGAWIIRGKKNFITHLELKLAIGFQNYENRKYIVSAPPSAIKGNKIIIIPGSEKEEIVNRISDFFKVDKESVYPVLPPGGSKIIEIVEEDSDSFPESEKNYNEGE